MKSDREKTNPDDIFGPGQRPRYLIVINEIGFVYSHFWALVTAIRRAGWDVVIASRDEAGSKRAIEAGMRFILLPLKIGIGGPWAEVKAVLALRAAIRACNPDVAHFVSLKNVLIGGLLTRRHKGIATLGAVTGLGTLFLEPRWRYSFLRPLVMKGLQLAYSKPRSIMSMENHDDRNFFVGKGVISKERSFIIPGAGLDTKAISCAPRTNDRPIVLCVSRMIRSKGIMHLIDAVHILHREGLLFDLLLVGDIDEHNSTSLTRTEMRSAESGEGVKWLGHRTDIPALLQKATIVCLPSYGEGLPRSLIEAAAAGCPIVTSDVAGCRDVVVDQLNGLLVPPRDVDALANALRFLLCDPERCMQMGIQSRLRFENHFTTLSVFDAFNKCYAALDIPLQVQHR